MLLETLRCENGAVLHLPYHQARLDQSLKCIHALRQYDLKSLIHPPSAGIYRCRFLYDETEYKVEFHPYTPRVTTSLKLIYDDTIDYSLKDSNRDALNALYEQRGECDDILIVKNGLLTDTSIANVALWIEGKWFTPQTPLLAGTTRARLLDEGFLTPALLHPGDIARATKVAIFNAMVDFLEVESGIIS
ncbi:MAG: aminotransferase class IV family protein [Sulfuricurvum sp.]|uniref:aminotransferase class IV family protein n=1 Tax=Sulfuricurvum sp. TaxID=2025608 RepID=UPI002615F613|nr:aminotransferase class IV family protein [Sulfuricurvum sp.]MDD2949713.1 aminotransferase class IV family protein [Sulfuricurvum sp.]MDD5119272.1 aminotransferase class IV family protein [Sulfuricurvum sp.]